MEYFNAGHCARRLVITLSMTILMPDIAIADPPEHEQDFRVGDSCAALAFGDADAHLWLVESLYAVELEEFCYPEEPLICSDYSALIEGIGRLEYSDVGREGCAV